jgi:hypothetical protein
VLPEKWVEKRLEKNLVLLPSVPDFSLDFKPQDIARSA